jgi:hypothetical protein
VHPYYHRKYVFVSLGGYWPAHYTCVRYYWYGCHPWEWYGYYPLAREVEGDTYNYYTYNYNYGSNQGAAETTYIPAADGIRPVDENTFADVREKLAQEKAEEPDAQTLADAYFDEAVQAFEDNNYSLAAEKFASAMELAPDDMILPFAYSQALFAWEKYSDAAEVLRLALQNVSPEKEGVFYPRGLYADEEILSAQVDKLAEWAKQNSFDSDLQLLLGYHLLGVAGYDEAEEPLKQASLDYKNYQAATELLELLGKIRADESRNVE